MKSSRIRKSAPFFDRGGDPNARMGGFGEGGFSSAGFDFTNLVDAMFGGSSPFGSGGGRGPRSRTRRGQDALVRMRLSLAEAVFWRYQVVRSRHRSGVPEMPG
ncbi:chaperone protein DnaJ [Cutibacterium acnes JCM 18916]|nr:chaperone protein DnaJ [Cutibacterium acnes JCM 18916]